MPKTSGSREILPALEPSDLKRGAVSSATSLHRLFEQDHGALGTGHGTVEENEVPLGVHTDHLEVEGGHLLVAYVAGHAHALEDTGGRGAGADGTGGTVLLVVAVRGVLVGEAMMLHHIGEVLVLGDTGDVGLDTLLEHLGDRDLLPDLVLSKVVDTNLDEMTGRLDT